MKETKKKENKKVNREEKKPGTGNAKDSRQPAEKTPPDDFENSTTYRKDPKTGKWVVQNPSGSMVYNYLYRDLSEG
jgi:hypothetical protein